MPRAAGARCRAFRSIGSLVLLGLLLAPARAAEPLPDPDLSLDKTRKVGPFRLRPYALLKDVGYDDNISFDSANPEGDSTATAGAGLDGLMLWGDRGGLRFSAEGDYVAFGDNTDLNHWDSAARARGIYLVKHAVISLEDRFTSKRERPNTEIDQRLRRKNNVITAKARSRKQGRLSFDAALRSNDIDYSDDASGSDDAALRLNRNEGALLLGSAVRILPKTTLTIDGIFEEIDFDSDVEMRDSEAQTFLGGFRFDPSASIQGHFRIGVKSLDALERPQDNTDVTVGDAALSTRLGRRARFKGTYNRDLVFSTQAQNLYFTDSLWSAAYEHFFTRRVSGELAFGRGRSEYPNDLPDSTTGLPGERVDRRITYGAKIRYRINGELSLVVNAERFERDSTDDVLDQERNFYGIGSTYNF